MNNIYLQKQKKSNLCRMYSLNNYFGYEKINENDFENYCKKYDEFIKGINTYNNDGFSEGRCLTSYIIELLDNKFFILPGLSTSLGFINNNIAIIGIKWSHCLLLLFISTGLPQQ